MEALQKKAANLQSGGSADEHRGESIQILSVHVADPPLYPMGLQLHTEAYPSGLLTQGQKHTGTGAEDPGPSTVLELASITNVVMSGSLITQGLNHDTILTVIDILDVGHSRQSQLEKHENSGRQQVDGSTDDDGNTAQKSILTTTLRLSVQTNDGKTFFMLFRKPPLNIPKLGCTFRLIDGEFHRGVLLVNSEDLSLIQSGMKLTSDDIKKTLAIDG